MGLWIIYAIFSAIFMRLYVFVQKLSAEKNHNSANTTIYSMMPTSILGFIYIIITRQVLENLFFVIIFALINIIFYYIAVVARIEALRSIPTTIFFPLYKIIPSMTLLK